ncbi:MAG: homoserine dehydrogenase [Firmicutes bacterium]|nr:homoserine dehydrogenase [Bacillota bacterium]
MINIAILGYGVVGSGVYRAIAHNGARLAGIAKDSVRVKRVCDLRDFPGDPAESLLTRDFNDILNDGEISLLVESMGGEHPALEYTRAALSRGMHVVTSNKNVVAAHGPELMALARENRVSYLFEASVGGAIPVIRPLTQILMTDEITRIMGIVNGTTNYILSRIEYDGMSFEEALKEAQRLGYAEKDPSDDINGVDAVRKLAILLSLVLGKHVDYKTIHTESMSEVTVDDFIMAGEFGRTIKLLVIGDIVGERSVQAVVAPFLIKLDTPLSAVKDAYNGVFVTGRITDDIMLYGKGAGSLPTAAAIASDIVYAASHQGTHIPHVWDSEPADIVSFDDMVFARFVRFTGGGKYAADAVKAAFGGESVLAGENGQRAFLAPPMSERDFGQALKKLKAADPSVEIKSSYRSEW